MSPSRDDLQAIADRRVVVASLVAQRMSVTEIAARLEVSLRTVSRDRVALGLAREPNVTMTAQELATMQEMLDEGMCYAEVGRTTGRNPRAIWKRLPGYSLDRHQIAERASWGRAFAKIS